ncbi:hypothetical protein NP233_g11346 [Leucocoprinus birnbaumii]|uniref:Uncharacterized protein n=1 Tax=Leucocoprinus birnbaumii TaxID=56174 RepID=A0AAD5VGQ4_9AGAR|nr:hypothetical protein NP233_g11346 [Leucocoprinus birnbaumii]
MVGETFAFKLLPTSILIIASSDQTGSASLYDLETVIKASFLANSSFSAETSTIQSTGSLLARYYSKFFSVHYSIFLPTESMPYTPAELPVLSIDKETGEARLFQLGIPSEGFVSILDAKPHLVEPRASFWMKPSKQVDFVGLGPTGNRMAWMEILPGDDLQIKKAILPTSGEKEVVISEILPQSEFPVKHSDCISLWLDERRGRICVSTLSQQIYTLDL